MVQCINQPYKRVQPRAENTNLATPMARVQDPRSDSPCLYSQYGLPLAVGPATAATYGAVENSLGEPLAVVNTGPLELVFNASASSRSVPPPGHLSNLRNSPINHYACDIYHRRCARGGPFLG